MMSMSEMFSMRKENAKKRKEIEKDLSYKMRFVAARGESHIFTPIFKMGRSQDGYAIINGRHKVKVISCIEYTETTATGKSTKKKLSGAALGGIITGGAGAIVGALAVGNSKNIKERFDLLKVIDEDGHTHEVLLKQRSLQRAQINHIYLGGVK